MNQIGQIKRVNILLVEDSLPDIELTREALERDKLYNQLYVTRDGVEALEFLRKEGKYQDAPRPGLILLDLNLPRMDGRELIEIIKNDEELRTIPIVVMTTSKAEEDILKAYDHHVNCYITKPMDFEKFFQVVRMIEQFWLTIVQLPGGGD